MRGVTQLCLVGACALDVFMFLTFRVRENGKETVVVMEDGVVTSRTVDGEPVAIEGPKEKGKGKKQKYGESKHIHSRSVKWSVPCLISLVWISALTATMFLYNSHV